MPSDPNAAADLAVKLATEAPASASQSVRTISEYLATIGRKGGIKGGKARAANLTPEKRSEIARIAAASRWADKSK